MTDRTEDKKEPDGNNDLMAKLQDVGQAVQEVLPLPSGGTQPVTDPNQEEVAHSLAEDPSLSHALATGDHEVKGLAQTGQQPEGAEVLDLGWNQRKPEIAEPLVGGLDNEELWLLLRRFDKVRRTLSFEARRQKKETTSSPQVFLQQMYHVKAIPNPVPGGLDLNIADEEEFFPDKLRANLERVYMTVIVSLLAAVKHIARLRSWRETRRTSCFAAAYAVAWIFDFLVPLLTLTAMTLILSPRARSLLFPPAPVALVSAKTGDVQTPRAGALGSHDSATGASENYKGEAVEQEASNFVNGIASIALSSAAGKRINDNNDDDDDDADNTITPDPTSLAQGAAEARAAATDGKQNDQAKVPMQAALWAKTRPLMRILADTADTHERLANALSPTPPFPSKTPRLRLALLLAPLLCVSLSPHATAYAVTKTLTLALGCALFGDPVLRPALALLNRRFPHWQKLLEMRNTVLKGVPTNAQLTLTLLRVGEARRAPLPPPPKPGQADDNDNEDEDDDAAQGGDEAAGQKKKKMGSRIVGFLRGTTKGAVKTAMGTDAARAKVTGSNSARERLGVVKQQQQEDGEEDGGPVEFEARCKGEKGTVWITCTATTPAVAFTTTTMTTAITTSDNNKPRWSVAVAEIVELRKFGGYGWKAKMVVGWALRQEVTDGLEIVLRDGERVRITACPLRDELFNRLVAMGGQKWEAW